MTPSQDQSLLDVQAMFDAGLPMFLPEEFDAFNPDVPIPYAETLPELEVAADEQRERMLTGVPEKEQDHSSSIDVGVEDDEVNVLVEYATRSKNSNTIVIRKRTIPENNLGTWCRNNNQVWGCLGCNCTKEQARNMFEDRIVKDKNGEKKKGKPTATFWLKRGSSVFSCALCRRCRDRDRSSIGPFAEIKTATDVDKIGEAYKRQRLGKPLKSGSVLLAERVAAFFETPVAELQDLTHVKDLVARGLRRGRKPKNRDQSPKRSPKVVSREPSPEPQNVVSVLSLPTIEDELQKLYTEIENGPEYVEVNGIPMNRQNRKRREMQKKMGLLIESPVIVEKPKKIEPEVFVEPRICLPRWGKAESNRKIAELKENDELMKEEWENWDGDAPKKHRSEDEISQVVMNTTIMDIPILEPEVVVPIQDILIPFEPKPASQPVEELLPRILPTRVPKRTFQQMHTVNANHPCIIQSIFGMIDVAYPKETLADVKLWQDLLPELRNCKLDYAKYFKYAHPETWNIFLLVRNFRFVAFADDAFIAAHLYTTCQRELAAAQPKSKVDDIVIKPASSVDAICESYIKSVLDTKHIPALTQGLTDALALLCDLVGEEKTQMNKSHLCQQLRGLLQGDLEQGPVHSMKQLIKFKE
jgi:hypothetical protein